jgi:glycosyltransferase involved in cell wall biosynthesis
MKIIYVDPMSENSLENYDKNLLSNLSNEEVIYFCSKNIETKSIKNTTIIKIYNYKNKNLILKLISYIISQLRLFKYILGEDIKILHFQWIKLYWFDYILFLVLLKNIKNIKIILTAHNVLPHDSGKKFYNIHKKIYKCLDGIIVHNIKTKRELVSEFGIESNKISVIQHGVLDHFEIENKELKSREKIVFGLIGNLQEYKGVDILLEAWQDKEILDNTEIELIIAGKKEIELSYPRNKNIILIDRFLEKTEFEEIIREIDIFVFPYRKISQSGVLLSILRYHKPIIVSNIGGLTEVFDIGKIGWILKENTKEELRKVIKSIIKNKEEVSEIKENHDLWKKIEKHYSWEKIGEKTEKFYIKIIQK